VGTDDYGKGVRKKDARGISLTGKWHKKQQNGVIAY
jgi:hypothetical protein